VTHRRKRAQVHDVDAGIAGQEILRGKQSAVDASGDLRIDPIDGVRFRPTRPVPHEDGHLLEIARPGWAVLDAPIVQVHMTTTLPGRVRAWGLHRNNTDRLFVARGLVRIACYDGRRASSTFGRVNEFTLSDRNPGLVILPCDLYHGWKNIGEDEAIIINMPTRAYNYDSPDALDLPWDSPQARSLIPYAW
jgi:dTDP-4-dehydrorhamnose 3,5-epimerase